MKKIIVLLMVALVAVALVACGGEAATTTEKPAVTTPAGPAATTPATTTNEVPSTGTTTTPTVNTTKTPGETSKTPGTTDTPNTQQGIDILNGEFENMAIDPTWKAPWPCAFENHHPEINFQWCVVVKMLPTENFIQEELIAMDEETGFGIAFDDYTWVLTIDGEDYVVEEFCIPQRTGFIYIRMVPSGDWSPVMGEHEYDIKLTIKDSGTNEVVYYAYFTDPEWGGPYYYVATPPVQAIPTEKPENVEQLPTGALTGISGPESLAATETYAKLFDGFVQTKLCSSDYTNPLIFTVSDANFSSFVGISLVGANDDQKFPERVPVKFTLYGSDDGSDDSWSVVIDVNQTVDEIEVTNYGEHYYGFSDAVEYRYFKLVIEDVSGAATPKYQYSEILLFTEK